MDRSQKELLDKLRTYLSLEQEFHHKVWVENVRKLDKDDFELALALIHTSYLIRGTLLENICKYCVRSSIDLPSFGELIELDKDSQ